MNRDIIQGIEFVEDPTVLVGQARVFIDDPNGLSSRVFGVRSITFTIAEPLPPDTIEAAFVIEKDTE